MSAADVTPAFVAELRKTHEGKQSKLREHHPRGSWAWLALDILDLCDAIESAWAERDAYLDEVRMTNDNEARIMADLLATREERDRLRAELSGLRAAPVAVEVPKLTLAEAKERSRGTTNPGVAFGWGYDHAVSRIQLFDPSRILKEGERAVDSRRFDRMLSEESERHHLLEVEQYVRTMAYLERWSDDTMAYGPLHSLDTIRSKGRRVMPATISGWAPDPHDADAPEGDDTCEGCGVETEDLWECDLTREEARELKNRPTPGKNWLCLSCLSHVERMREDDE